MGTPHLAGDLKPNERNSTQHDDRQGQLGPSTTISRILGLRSWLRTAGDPSEAGSIVWVVLEGRDLRFGDLGRGHGRCDDQGGCEDCHACKEYRGERP